MKKQFIEIPDNFRLEKTENGYVLVEEQKPDLSIVNDTDWFYVETITYKWFSKGNIFEININNACHIMTNFTKKYINSKSPLVDDKKEIKFIRKCTDSEIELIYQNVPELREKKDKYQWEDYGPIDGVYFDDLSKICKYSSEKTLPLNKATIPTTDLAEQFTELFQVLNWMQKPEYNNNWEWDKKSPYYTIDYDFSKNEFEINKYLCLNGVLKFKDQETAERFINDFPVLLDKCKYLI